MDSQCRPGASRVSWWVFFSASQKGRSKAKNTCQGKIKKKKVDCRAFLSQRLSNQPLTGSAPGQESSTPAWPKHRFSGAQGSVACMLERHPSAWLFSITKCENFPLGQVFSKLPFREPLMCLSCLSLVLALSGEHRGAEPLSAGRDLGARGPTSLWPKRKYSTQSTSTMGASSSGFRQGKHPRVGRRHRTCGALCLQARLRCHTSGTACTCGSVAASAAASPGERRALHLPRAVAAQNSPWENTFPPQGDHWSCQVPPSLCCHWPHCPPSHPV